MARQRDYSLDTTVSALDRLTGIDSMDNRTKNFTIDSIAQLFASSGIADPSKISFFYDINASRSANVRGQSYFNFITGLENTFAGVNQIIINRYDSSGVGATAQGNPTGADFTPLQRFVIGGEIKLTSVSRSSDFGYGLYAIESVTPSADGSTVTLGVAHTASQGSLPNNSYTISIIGSVAATARGSAIYDGTFVPEINNPQGNRVGDLFIRIETTDTTLYVRREAGWELVTSLTGQQGIPGPQGPIGPQGDTGQTGQQGDSVTGARDNGDGTVTFSTPAGDIGTANLRGPMGLQGEMGERGQMGDAGADGAQGERGFSVTGVTATGGTMQGESTTLQFTGNDPDNTNVGLPVTVQSGVQGVQGEQGFSITEVRVDNTNPPAGTALEVTFLTDNPDMTANELGPINIPPGATGTVEQQTVMVTRAEGNEELVVDAAGAITLTLNPQDAGPTVDSPAPRINGSTSMVHTGSPLTFNFTITDQHGHFNYDFVGIDPITGVDFGTLTDNMFSITQTDVGSYSFNIMARAVHSRIDMTTSTVTIPLTIRITEQPPAAIPYFTGLIARADATAFIPNSQLTSSGMTLAPGAQINVDAPNVLSSFVLNIINTEIRDLDIMASRDFRINSVRYTPVTFDGGTYTSFIFPITTGESGIITFRG